MDQAHTALQLIGFGTIAAVFPIYQGFASAFFIIRRINRSWEGFWIGIALGVLVYLFFDVMHEATEQTV
ncbi:MAG: hypothetical protein NPIRA02_27320 [Nitrospirales bacterium]|nr:MAG: hypothetical protein NPIRA02_27320 [Nitrospirales bacterium]